MTEELFKAYMRSLFRVWEGTENADDILTDVVGVFGSRYFDRQGQQLRNLEATCGSLKSRALYKEDAR